MDGRILGILGAGAILSTVAVPTGTGARQDSDSTAMEGAARLFKQRCAGCHVAPDVRFKTDKAWLGQIKQTA